MLEIISATLINWEIKGLALTDDIDTKNWNLEISN